MILRNTCVVVAAATLMLLTGCRPAGNHESKNREAFEHLLAGMSPQGERITGGATDSMSAAGFERQRQEVSRQLDDLARIDTSLLSPAERIDWRFAQSILHGKETELNRIRPWTRDPRLYMAFTGIRLVLDGPADPAKKMDEVNVRLNMAVVQLENGMRQLDTHVPRFRELGLFMAENGLGLFDRELPDFLARHKADTMKAHVSAARQALAGFIHFLKEDLPGKPAGDFAIGPEAYNELLARHYLLGYDADSLYAFGKAHFDATVKELSEMASRIKPGATRQEVAAAIKSEYPDPHQMIEVHQEWVNKSRDHVLKNKLIPIPWKEQVRVVERAPYLRKTSYYGHFSFAREKDSTGTYTSEMHINPFEDQWDEKTKKEYLLEHDWGVILVTAPHETYAGHHIQGLYQANNPSSLRRDHSISIFSEGWGLYNEQLMRETGFFPNDKILFRQVQLRLWRIARVVYDVGLHTGKMSYDDAVKLMTDGVGFLPWAAQLEIDAACASPGYFIGYFTGMQEILALREAYRRQAGEKFSLSDFHEQLLKAGSMPIPLMRAHLLSSLKTTQP